MIFLSASIPTPGREFYGTEDIVAIREAVMAFTFVCVENKIPFYFGGHPAITPIIWDVAKEYSPSYRELIKIYQSKWFEAQTPAEVDYFPNIVWTDRKETLKDSVILMREQMFSENDTDMAVFIGGMDGIIDESKRLQEHYENIKMIPVATTGGTSARLYKDMHLEDADLISNYAYVSIFRKKLL